MKVKLLGPPALAAVLFLLVSVPIFAHHGAASYDISKMTTLKGTITSIQWMNPHATIDIDVSETTGKIQKYTVESVSPLGLSRNGWTKDSLKPGDQITVTGNLSKNGTHILRLKKIVFPDGKVVDTPERRGLSKSISLAQQTCVKSQFDTRGS